ncbi:MAG: hypothetical protein AAF429_03000 [Pseudomonadota bacterium]
MGKFKRLFCVPFLVLLFTAGLIRADVTLSSKFGDLVVTGELVEFKDGFYTLQTEDGVLTLRESDVTCQGLDCPILEDFSQRVSILPGHHLDKLALLKLFKSYTAINKLRFIQQGDPANPDYFEISDPSGSKIVEVTFEKRPDSFRITSETPDVAFASAPVQVVSNAEIVEDGLTPDQLRAIWRGDITDWSELGGPLDPIRVLAPAFFQEIQIALQPAESIGENAFGPQTELFLSPDQILAEAKKDDSAIGFLVSTKRHLNAIPLNHCKTSMTFTDEPSAYPLIAPIGFKSSSDRVPSMAIRLIEFLRSEAATNVLSSLNLVPFNPSASKDCEIDSQ